MEKTTAINVAYPTADSLRLRIGVGTCQFHSTPGADDAWVRGAYRDPDDALPIKITQDGGTVEITQERDSRRLGGQFRGEPPTLELGLGATRPYKLTIESGASENMYDLGGLPLTDLVLKQGGGKFTVAFSAPNPAAMALLDLDGGAGAFEMRNLANANAAEMTMDGGASAYTFEFGGLLQQNTSAEINVGVSSLEIVVPATTAAQIHTEAVLGAVDVGDGFTKQKGAFWTQAALAGAMPLLTIEASVAVGSLRLRTT